MDLTEVVAGCCCFIMDEVQLRKGGGCLFGAPSPVTLEVILGDGHVYVTVVPDGLSFLEAAYFSLVASSAMLL